jgi:hypothetical protein
MKERQSWSFMKSEFSLPRRRRPEEISWPGRLRLPGLSPRELAGLNLEVDPDGLRCSERDTVGIF